MSDKQITTELAMFNSVGRLMIIAHSLPLSHVHFRISLPIVCPFMMFCHRKVNAARMDWVLFVGTKRQKSNNALYDPELFYDHCMAK